MRKNSFIQGALILTVAGIIVKFIGAFSRIYLSRLLGGEKNHGNNTDDLFKYL